MDPYSSLWLNHLISVSNNQSDSQAFNRGRSRGPDNHNSFIDNRNEQPSSFSGKSRYVSDNHGCDQLKSYQNQLQQQIQYEEQQQNLQHQQHRYEQQQHQLQLQEQLRQQYQHQLQLKHQQHEQELALEVLHNSRRQIQVQVQSFQTFDNQSTRTNQSYQPFQLIQPQSSHQQHFYGVLHYGSVSQSNSLVAAAAWWIADQYENILVQGSVAIQQVQLTPIRVEYEALQHGISAALGCNITHLSIKGVSDLIKSQFASNKVFPYFRTIYHTVRHIIPIIQNSLSQFVSCSFEVISLKTNHYVKMLADEAISTHQRRQELAVYNLVNEVYVSQSKSTKNIAIPASAPAPVSAPLYLPLPEFVKPTPQISANYSPSNTMYDSTYDSSVCDPSACGWMSSDSISPSASCYSRHSSPSLPSSIQPSCNVPSKAATQGFSNKSLSSDSQSGFLMFRIVN